MSDDRLELEALRTQLYDAIKDTQLWGQCDPSNEERLYIYKMQIVLDDWLRCVERRIDGGAERDEDQHCGEHSSQFLHFYKKASEVQGRGIGKQLGRLAEKVGRAGAVAAKLTVTPPKRRVTNAPPPLTIVGGGWIRSQPKPAEVPTDFPPSFPSELRLKTSGILGDVTKEFPDGSKLEQLCRVIVSRLTKLLCKAVREGTIKGHAAPDQLKDLLQYVCVANCDNDNERFRVKRAVINSEEWLTLLKSLAKCTSGEPHGAWGGAKQSSDSRNAHKRISAFIEKLLMAGYRIRRKDISRVAGYKDSTELQRFQRSDRRTTEAGIQNFNRVLAMSTEDFMGALNNRGSR